MGKRREMIYAVCGERGLKHMTESIRIVRQHDKDINIKIYHDASIRDHSVIRNAKDCAECRLVEYQKTDYDRREGNRNNDLWKLRALLESDAESVAYLDSDVFVYDWQRFAKGFEITKRFGVLFPMNPRTFVKVELDIGADVTPHDRRFFEARPGSDCSTAYNMGVIFYSHNANEQSACFLHCAAAEQEANPSRGPMAVQRAMWITGYAPYALPVNWLVCTESVGIKIPIALHVGHDKVMEWYRQLTRG